MEARHPTKEAAGCRACTHHLFGQSSCARITFANGCRESGTHQSGPSIKDPCLCGNDAAEVDPVDQHWREQDVQAATKTLVLRSNTKKATPNTEWLYALERTRTSTGLPPYAPQAYVSTNSTTRACFKLRVTGLVSKSSEARRLPMKRICFNLISHPSLRTQRFCWDLEECLGWEGL